MEEQYDSSSIKVLTLADAVRKRPGMYFGQLNGSGVNSLIGELVANSVDQFLAGNASTVKLSVSEETITVSDDGLGLPFNIKAKDDAHSSLLESYMLGRHNTATADNHAPHIHLSVGGGLGGLGLAIVNAACLNIDIISSDGTYTYKQSFGKGKALSEMTKEEHSKQSGTTLQINIDKELFNGCGPDYLDLRKTMFELAHFYPGLIVEYLEERFFSQRGLLDLAYIHYENDSFCKKEINPTKFYFNGKKNDTSIQVAAIGSSDSAPILRSWVNGYPSIEGGTHVEGLLQALSTSGWSPKLAFIQVIMHDPQYAGPSRDALRNLDTKEIVQKLLSMPLTKFRK